MYIIIQTTVQQLDSIGGVIEWIIWWLPEAIALSRPHTWNKTDIALKTKLKQ